MIKMMGRRRSGGKKGQRSEKRERRGKKKGRR